MTPQVARPNFAHRAARHPKPSLPALVVMMVTVAAVMALPISVVLAQSFELENRPTSSVHGQDYDAAPDQATGDSSTKLDASHDDYETPPDSESNVNIINGNQNNDNNNNNNEQNPLAEHGLNTVGRDDDSSASSSNNNNNNIDQTTHHSHTHPDSDQHSNDTLLDELQRHPNDHKEFLDFEVAREACQRDRGCTRRDRLNNTYLGFCSRHKIDGLFSSEILMTLMHNSSDECSFVLKEFIKLDEMIEHFYHMFENLLKRYNCANGYSVKWHCDDCKRAYKDWLCSINLPYYMKGERIKPCISFCERVEQRCPYLHPITKEQYGGQPVFICRDPNVPFVPRITPDIPYSEPIKCYDLCHLSDNLTELSQDSLSKYQPDKCPDMNTIAEQVRSDPVCSLDPGNKQGLPTDEIETVTEVPTTRQHAQNGVQNDTAEHAQSQTPTNPELMKGLQVVSQKLKELQEVLDLYKNQPQSQKFSHYSEHSSTSHGLGHENKLAHLK